MKDGMRVLSIVSGALAFAFCLVAGLWILTATGLDHEKNYFATAIGLYFIGKAFFVGPAILMLGNRKRDA